MQENKGICLTLIALAEVSKDLNEKENQLKFLNRAKEIAESENLKKESENIFFQLSQYYEKENPGLALQYYQKYSTVKDSIFNETKSKQITELNTKYQVEKKELTLKEQKLTILKKNYLLIGIITGALLLTLLGISYYRRMRLIEEKKSQEAVVKEQQKATIAVLQAEEKERKRVAAELHDGVGQMMSVARMHLSQFEELAIANGIEYKEKYDHLTDLIDDSCEEVRNISHQMMPNALLKQGLAKAVRNFITQVKNPKLSINLYTEGLDEDLPEYSSAMLYRIIQECVNNVIKHSEATSLDISLLRNETEIRATIEDNGKGFDISQNNYKEGIGLQNIRDRITFLKGEVEIDSKAGKGTLIAIYIPI
jgi:signal transduction histidine kinase